MISGFKKVSIVIFGLIISILLATIIHVDPSHPWFDLVFILPPIIGGFTTGWLNQKYDRSIFVIYLLVFLPLLIIGVATVGPVLAIDNPNTVNDAFTRLIEWFIFIQIGGKLGSMLYQKIPLKK